MDPNLVDASFLKYCLINRLSEIDKICFDLSFMLGDVKTAELKGCIIDLFFAVHNLSV